MALCSATPFFMNSAAVSTVGFSRVIIGFRLDMLIADNLRRVKIDKTSEKHAGMERKAGNNTAL